MLALPASFARSLARCGETPDHPWGSMGDEELLRSAKPHRKDRIAGVFKEMGYAEELGSGFRSIHRCSLAYSGKSAILEDGDVFKAVVPLTPISAARGGEGALEAVKLLCERDGFVSSGTLSEYLGVTTRTAQRHIRRLLDDGLIYEDPARARSYMAK